MPDTTIAALLARRAELAAQLDELERLAVPIRADIFHLDAAIAIMGNGSAPRMRAQHRPDDQLAVKLAEIGVNEQPKSLRNKVARGGFSAVFFVQCLKAIDCTRVVLDAE